MARARARGTAWVRHYAGAGSPASGAPDLRLEGAVDLRRRICVAGEAGPAPAAGLSRTTSGGDGVGAGALLEPLAARRVVYAGGSRYVAGEEGWDKVEGDVEGPRLAADPVWLLDALQYAEDCTVAQAAGGVRVSCRLDLSGATDLDLSAVAPPARWTERVRPFQRRRREAWLRAVPCVVELDGDGLVARMSFATLPADDTGEAGWATTEIVEYGVPVDMPDLLARTRPAAWRGRAARTTLPTR